MSDFVNALLETWLIEPCELHCIHNLWDWIARASEIAYKTNYEKLHEYDFFDSGKEAEVATQTFYFRKKVST